MGQCHSKSNRLVQLVVVVVVVVVVAVAVAVAVVGSSRRFDQGRKMCLSKTEPRFQFELTEPCEQSCVLQNVT